jgi:hypothetical protein
MNVPSKVSTFAQAYIKNRCEIDTVTGCWVWKNSGDRRGYGMIKHAHFGSVAMYVHRAMWYACGREIPEGMILLHACDNPKCCNPDHLSLGTHKENTADMLGKDRQHSKLSNDDVVNLKEMISIYGNESTTPKQWVDFYKSQAKIYNVSPQTIRLIHQGKIWKHVE